jgi:anti-sigma factor RsiW
MTCQQCVESLHAYVDGELSPDEMDAVRAHLDTCAACAQAHASIRDTSRLLRANLMRYPAPDVLKARIRASAAAEEQSASASATARPRTWSRRWSQGWSRTATAAVVAAMLGSVATASVMRRGMAASAATDDVLASHIRSLMPGHLTDVASNDQHNVKPWFNGRVNLSPPVPRLDSVGFPLLGGRLDYVGGRQTAVVVYMRRQHVINVFWRPAAGERVEARPTMSSDNGYNMIRGRRDGLEYWIVSDLNRAELDDFRRRLELD